MPPPPPVSSTRTATTLRPGLSTPGGDGVLAHQVVADGGADLHAVDPGGVDVVDHPQLQLAGGVAAAAAGRSKVLRNQTTPLRSGSPASSHSVGSAIVFQPSASSAGSLQRLARDRAARRGRRTRSRAWPRSARRAASGSAISSLRARRACRRSRAARRSPASLVQASAGVPPHELWMMPIGTCRAFCRSRREEVADGREVLDRLGRADGPLPLHRRRAASATSPARRRSGGSAGASAAAASFSQLSIGCCPARRPSCRSMFDWPPAIQTSPTRMSLEDDLVLAGDGQRERAAGLERREAAPRHLPSAPAVVEAVWPAISTVTASPGSAVPQTGTAVPCCSTA